MSNSLQMTPYVTHLKSLCDDESETPEDSDFWKMMVQIEIMIGESRMRSIIQVLHIMENEGDQCDIDREIFHWAYFQKRKNAKFFVKRVLNHGYRFIGGGPVRKSKEICVQFSHFGPARLPDMAMHIAQIENLLPGTRGVYDGWETSVERDSDNAIDIEQSPKSSL